jgi:hypothetical protein
MRAPRSGLLRLLVLSVLLAAGGIMAPAGINWLSVWLEPNTQVVLTVGETQPYAVWGLDGMKVRSNLTQSQYLKISSSNPDVIEIDRKNGTFIGKKPGHSIIRFSFSEASNVAQGVVKEKDEVYPPRR